MPPEKPCRARHAISIGKWPLAAHPTEASVNTETESTNSQHMLSKRVRKPVSGIATTSAIRYAVCTQLIWSGGMSSAP